MKTKTKIITVLGAVLAIVFVATFLPKNANDPVVLATIDKLPKPKPEARTRLTLPASSQIQPRPEKGKVPTSTYTVGVAGEHVLADAIALSSFFAASELVGLSDEQLAQLETVLTTARKATYALLIERGKVTAINNGDFKIEIAPQGDAFSEMRKYVSDSIQTVVGEERMESFKHNLGPKFDAKFAYFGEYDTTIELSLEYAAGSNTAPQAITMRSSYDGVRFGFGRGKATSTHVLRTEGFEKKFVSLDSLRPKS